MLLIELGLAGGVLLLVIATLLPLSRYPKWWVRGLDFPRLQLGIAALILLSAQLFIFDANKPLAWFGIVAALACLAYHLWWIIPFTPLFPKEVKSHTGDDTDAKQSGSKENSSNSSHSTKENSSKDTVRIMTANVLTPNRNARGLVNLVNKHNPDILVTLESDSWWQQQLVSLEADYPHTIQCPLDNLYGMHVYSRLPLTEASIEYLVEPDVPSMHACAELPSGKTFSVHFLHPAPPSPSENDESTERDAELLVVAKSVAKRDGPVIVTGDLNDVAWSETTRLFRKISRLLDPRVGRGMFNTYNAKHWFLRWPLDHLFHSKHFTLKKMERLEPFGSDHFALLTELVFSDTPHLEQESIKPDADDKELAKEKIQEEGVSVSEVPKPAAN